MAYDKTQSIDEFLTAASAKQPTPGGGSVAALAGALAAAMGQMVVNYSLDKKELAEHQDALKNALTEVTRARQILLELMVEDQAAYEALTGIRKLPAGDPQRAGKLDAALLACIRIPQAIGTTAAAILDLSNQIAHKVNKLLLSDLAVCAELSMATVRCAAYNVRVNLPQVTDQTERRHFEQSAARMVADAGNVIREAIARIWARQGYP
jgi:glutamate formiminotransferase/formiminotetrahydrofolate cyclodeaminase